MAEKKLNIHQRINAVMKKVAYVQKEDKTVNNQYRFVSHDAVTARLHPECVEAGINVVPTVVEHDQTWTQYEDTYNNNIKTKFRGFTSLVVDVAFVNIDDPEDKIISRHLGYGIDEQDKGPGKAISYACKMAMLKVFMLETGEDIERDLLDHKPAEKKKAWTGPLVKTKLDAALREYLHQVLGAETVEDVDLIFNDYVDVIKQAKKDDPIALNGDGKDHKGIIEDVKAHKARLRITENPKPKDL